jgi:amino acid transporter
MFILGTSSVLAFLGGQPVNVIGPIPQTLRAAAGNSALANAAVPFAISLLIARAVAAASLLLTGLTRLPMTAGWDHLVPEWFARLDPKRRTPVNSILVVSAIIVAVILLSMLGVQEQEASQLITNASTVHYAIAYVALFAIPVFGNRRLRAALPLWLKIASAAGMGASAVSLLISVYPVVDVVSRFSYAAKISIVVVVTNIAGVALYRAGRRGR